jgi:hypothetical protein
MRKRKYFRKSGTELLFLEGKTIEVPYKEEFFPFDSHFYKENECKKCKKIELVLYNGLCLKCSMNRLKTT